MTGAGPSIWKIDSRTEVCPSSPDSPAARIHGRIERVTLMGFRFVVARFRIFLQEVRAVQNSLSGSSIGLSLWFGTTLIASGVIVSIWAGLHHTRLVRNLGPRKAGATTLPILGGPAYCFPRTHRRWHDDLFDCRSESEFTVQ